MPLLLRVGRYVRFARTTTTPRVRRPRARCRSSKTFRSLSREATRAAFPSSRDESVVAGRVIHALGVVRALDDDAHTPVVPDVRWTRARGTRDGRCDLDECMGWMY